ncbi:MAG: hypothetical protein J0L66_03210 [Cytophagales bacterium]|nr:hypothetical protein [Cytophagales bacterium]
MIRIALLLICGFYDWVNAQPAIPFKPDTEFDFKFDYVFKERPPADKPDYEAPDAPHRPVRNGPLPYLKTELKLTSLNPNEVRLKVISSKGVIVQQKKCTAQMIIKLDWGFSDDVKDRVAPHQYVVQLLNEKKQPVSQIVLNAEPDGHFYINGQRKGRL